MEVSTVCSIDKGKAGALSFLANPKYIPELATTAASVVLVQNELKAEVAAATTLVRVADPYQAFATLLRKYEEMKRPASGIHPSVIMADSAKVGKGVSIAAGVVIGERVHIGDGVIIDAQVVLENDVTIGADTRLHAGVRVLRECSIGKRCTLHAGVIIGSDGFGFVPSDMEYSKMPQVGNVILEDDVEIGANCTIDRATMGSTVIREGVKLDNLIQVAHNVEIGAHTVIAAQTGIAGSTTIGERCMIGGQVGIIGHLTIGNDVKIAAQSGIGSDLPDKAIVQGSPAFDVGGYRRSYVSFKRLPDTLRDLEKRMKEMDKLG